MSESRSRRSAATKLTARRSAAIALTAALAVPATVFGLSGSASAATAQARSGTEHFTIVEVEPGNTGSVALSGPIKGVGTDYQGSDSSQSDLVVLPKGAFMVNHPDDQSTFTFTINPKTCIAHITGSGTYTLGPGYGAYSNISGSGTYQGRFTEQAARNADGTCNTDADPVAGQGVINGSGPVSY